MIDHSTARLTGLLFIVATVAALVAAALVPGLGGADYLATISADADQVAVSAILYLIAAFASAGIAVSLYPVLKATNAAMALGSVVFRTLEAGMYAIAVLGLLSLVSLGTKVTSGGAGDLGALQAIGDSMVSLRDDSSLAGVLAFSLGAFLYYYLFFQSRLVPRWLSGWGIVAVVLMASACVLALFGHNPVTGYAPLILPIAVQEMVLAAWLIVRGFSSSAVRSSRVLSPTVA